MRILTAIYDVKANDFVGNMIVIHRHPAAAIRMFSDAAANTKTDIGQHPEDYELVQLAAITSEDHPLDLIVRGEVLLTGLQWAAARAASLNPE